MCPTNSPQPDSSPTAKPDIQSQIVTTLRRLGSADEQRTHIGPDGASHELVFKVDSDAGRGAVSLTITPTGETSGWRTARNIEVRCSAEGTLTVREDYRERLTDGTKNIAWKAALRLWEEAGLQSHHNETPLSRATISRRDSITGESYGPKPGDFAW